MFLPKQFNRIVSLLVLQCRASCLCVSLCPSVFLFMCFFSSCVSALGVSFMCLHVSRHISLYVSLNLFLHASGFSSVLLCQGKKPSAALPMFSLSLSFFVFFFPSFFHSLWAGVYAGIIFGFDFFSVTKACLYLLGANAARPLFPEIPGCCSFDLFSSVPIVKHKMSSGGSEDRAGAQVQKSRYPSALQQRIWPLPTKISSFKLVKCLGQMATFRTSVRCSCHLWDSKAMEQLQAFLFWQMQRLKKMRWFALAFTKCKAQPQYWAQSGLRFEYEYSIGSGEDSVEEGKAMRRGKRRRKNRRRRRWTYRTT